MAKFTGQPWYDADGNITGTLLVETQGYFHGLKPEQVLPVAEQLLVNYGSANFSQTFADVYFNYTLRRKLREIYSDSILSDFPEFGDSMRSTTPGQPNSDSGGQSTDTDESASGG